MRFHQRYCAGYSSFDCSSFSAEGDGHGKDGKRKRTIFFFFYGWAFFYEKRLLYPSIVEMTVLFMYVVYHAGAVVSFIFFLMSRGLAMR